MGLSLRPVGAHDDLALDEWWRMHQAWADEITDHPPVCRTWTRARLAHPWPGERPHCWLAEVDGEVVGYLYAEVHERENQDVLGIGLTVRAEHRRRGYGAQLLASAHEFARVHGCTRLLTELPLDGPGLPWWEARGGRQVLVTQHRRLDVTTVDVREHERLLADARDHAQGYSVLQWVGSPPEELLADRAALEESFWADMPLEDLQWEPEKVDVEHMRAKDALVAAAGVTHLTTAARHEATGELVGITTLCRFATVPDHLDQWETIVLGPHRGHRLGLLLKLENLRLARERQPQARWHHTDNAASNDPMIAVNDALGFVPLRTWAECELAVTPR